MPTTSSSLADPTDNDTRKTKSQHVLQGSSAAGARALGTQLVAFYFRAPVKAFFRMRVDYMQVARAIKPAVAANAGWSFAHTTPGLLVNAVRHYGWGFIPRQVLPPMFANATVGAILYTTYLQTLAGLHPSSGQRTKRVYPPPGFGACFGAGFVAGGVQSVVAAPLDAMVVRFKVSEMLEGGIGVFTITARRSFLRLGLESLGYGLFFGSFEFVKQQAYFEYLAWYYSSSTLRRPDDPDYHYIIRPHYALEPIFLLLAGVSASITQQLVQHPLSKIQSVHYARLESIDYLKKLEHSPMSAFKRYRRSYKKTYEQCLVQAKKAGGWRAWLWMGLTMNTLRQIPSTSAGLFVFEIFRRRYGGQEEEGEHVIELEDRTILLG
ncbi:mitochondrial carrier domain-containing protein [Trichophaea hybrida]|nr:mitochondrial carrier domain-containing protein [Trichophaea hybrida]